MLVSERPLHGCELFLEMSNYVPPHRPHDDDVGERVWMRGSNMLARALNRTLGQLLSHCSCGERMR